MTGPPVVGADPTPFLPAPTATPRLATRTTHATIAVANLESQIAGIERLGRGHPLAVGEVANLADLRIQRGQLLGRISDYEAALALGEGLVRDAPQDGRSWVLRARAAATLHRFQSALADLDEAGRRGAAGSEVDGTRASIFQATGRLDEALAIRRRLAAARPSLASIGSVAIVQAARGELDQAEELFAAAQARYRDVSPFPVAWLDFQRGLMWLRENELERARADLAAAHERVPQSAPSAGHLAEVEAALGRTDRAVALLRPLAETVEDPDYAAQLARILGEAGRADEAKPWRDRAATRYDALMAKFPDAFADHAAEFWLAAGGDPTRALEYAEHNRALRPTVRAWELVLRAADAKGDHARACQAARAARAAGYLYKSAREAVDKVLVDCAD